MVAREINIDEIRYIKFSYKKIKVYDLNVENTHNYCITKKNIIVHNSGTGKTLLVNRLVSHLFHHWGANVSILNDYSEETYRWSEQMDFKEFNEFNKIYLDQEPCASPLIYLYPNTSTLKLDKKNLNGKNYLKIVIPFSEIIEDIGFYLEGVNPGFELKKSGMYINDLKSELLECETVTQIKETLEEFLPDYKGFKAMKIKIKTAFDSLFKEEIMDVTNPECHSYISLQGEELSNPFITLMKARTIPSLITSDLSNKKYKSQIFAYHINSIFTENLKKFNSPTYLIFDELRTVCEKDSEPAAQAIGHVSARGRINDVGLIYATQFYNKIPQCVKGAKLNYLFAFSHNSSEILKEIGSDFDLSKKQKEKIKKLRTFEVMAMTNNKFIFYRDGEKWEGNKPVIGRIFYPLAGHRKAGSGK